MTARRLLAALCGLMVMLAAAPAASAATYYLDRESRGGQCSDAYTEAQARENPLMPFCTPDAVEEKVPAGTVIVRGGDYGRFYITTPKSDWVIFREAIGERVTTTGVVLDPGSFYAFENMELTGYDPVTNTASDQRRGRFYLEGASDIRIEGMYIHDTLAAIYSKGVTRLTFVENTVERTRCVGTGIARCSDGNKSGYGIAQASGTFSDVVIARNRFSDIDGDAFQGGCTRCEITDNLFEGVRVQPGNSDHADAVQWSGSVIATDLLRNVFRRSSKGLCYCGGDTPRTWRDITVAENLSYDLANYSMVFGPTERLTVRGNTTWNTRYGVRFADTPANQPYSATDVFDNAFGPCGDASYPCYTSVSNGGPSSPWIDFWGYNLIAEENRDRSYAATDLVNPDQATLDALFDADFVPTEQSAARDRGITSPFAGVSPVDARGLQRVAGPTVDLGANERQLPSP